MRMSLLLFGPLLISCGGGQRPADAAATSPVASMDSAAVRRLCTSPDSVLAQKKQCELRDQAPSTTGEPVRPLP